MHPMITPQVAEVLEAPARPAGDARSWCSTTMTVALTDVGLRQLEGRQVSVALADGSRLDAVMLMSAGRGPRLELWVYGDGTDLFLSYADVVAVREFASAGRPG